MPTPVRSVLIRLGSAGLCAVASAAPVGAASELPRSLKDGERVTLQEVRAASAETFDALAGDGADSVSRDVFADHDLPVAGAEGAAAGDMLGAAFDRMDLDGDGVLTRAEWNEALEKDLGFADEDEDGFITMRELANARENFGVGDAIGMMF
jgi:putative lipase involved disintegration of autophagic bodies